MKKHLQLLKSLLCKVFGIIAIGCLSNVVFAQPGANDPTFNPGTGSNSYILATVLQNDGKIIIGGNFTSYNGIAINHIARLNTDGSLDATFNVGTGANYEVYATALQNDGKIIIGGYFSSYNGTAISHIARLNTNGSIDSTFDVGTGANSRVFEITIQGDGKIIIGGYFTSYNGTARNYIARLNTDGSLDTLFNVGSGADDDVEATSIQSDGKIIIGGLFTSYNGTARNHIARLNMDGSIDTSFNVGSGANNWVYATAVQSDGKIIIGGYFTSYNGTDRYYIARLNTDGSLDATFNVLGTGADGTVYTTSIQSDGKIIIGGLFTSYNGTARNHIARLITDGSLDTSFSIGTGANGTINVTSIQSDGKIIIGGLFTSYNGTARNRVARILGDSVLSIGSITLNNETLLYPNPSGDYVTIEAAEKSNIEIISIHGQTVKSLVSADSKTIVDLSGLVRGVYLIRIRTDKETLMRKIIKL